MPRPFFPRSRPVGGSVPQTPTPTTFGSVALTPSLARQGMAARYGATGSLGPMQEPTTGGIQGWMAPYRVGRGVKRGRPKRAQPPITLATPLGHKIRRLRPQYEARRETLLDEGDFEGVEELDRRWRTLLEREAAEPWK